MRQPAYDGWTRERLLEEVKKLKKRKKYGIVWEHKPEDVVEQCKRELPVLKEVKSKEIITDPTAPVNLLIEGDNYHALSVLNYTHKGKIDVIYIDPPYNTGARDWKYNNNYVDNNDSFRHSKWLSMMSSRLSLAKNLLKRDGVLIVMIDDWEYARLQLLLEEIFPGKEIVTVVIEHNPKGSPTRHFTYSHEYAIFVLPTDVNVINKDPTEKEDTRNLRRAGRASSREERPSMFYPIYVKNGKIVRVGSQPEANFHPKKRNLIEKSGEISVWPIDDEGRERRWHFGLDSINEYMDRIVVRESASGGIQLYVTATLGRYKTVWRGGEFDAGKYGTSMVKDLIGVEFPYPKSLYATAKCLETVIYERPDALVLDFFAGSGTTGHATLLLNKKDGGDRRFILCTNNENNIAEEITYPRIKKVIKGAKDFSDITKFDANLRYFKTSFVDAESTDANKEALTAQASEMLCVREGTFDQVKTTKTYKIFRGATKYTGIVFDQLALSQFKKELERVKGNWSVYIFSLGDDTFDEEFADFGRRVTVSPIPEAILRIYHRIFSSDNNYGA